MRLVGILTLSFLLAASSQAHESDRELQMKAANDELTKRVAELLDENAKLKAHVADVLKQMREAPSTTPVIAAGGCNPQAIFEKLMLDYRKTIYSGGRWQYLEPWLKQNGKTCTNADFDYIEQTFFPEMANTARSKELIRYFKNRR